MALPLSLVFPLWLIWRASFTSRQLELRLAQGDATLLDDDRFSIDRNAPAPWNRTTKTACSQIHPNQTGHRRGYAWMSKTKRRSFFGGRTPWETAAKRRTIAIEQHYNVGGHFGCSRTSALPLPVHVANLP